LKSLKLVVAFVAIATASAPLSAPANGKAPVAYFSAQAGVHDLSISLPTDAQDMIVAKVRLQERILYYGPLDLFLAHLRVTQVLQGNAKVGQILDIYLGERGDHGNITFPCTPDQRAREYTIITYISEVGLRRLAALPINQHEYEQWETEVSASGCLHGRRDYGEQR
jgi:hypothetical protein